MRMSDWSSDVCSSDLRVGLFSQRISRNSLVAKEAGVAEDDPTAIDGTKCAASGRGIKIPDLACREPARLCGLDDREGQWMLRYPLNSSGKSQQFSLLAPCCRCALRDGRSSYRWRAGLVAYKRVDLIHRHKRFCILTVKAPTCAHATAHTDHT